MMNRAQTLIAKLDDPKVVLKQLRIITIVAICALPLASTVAFQYISGREQDAWAQEDAALTIMAFHLHHRRFPSGWDEAVPFYPQHSYGGNLTPDATKPRVVIDFDHPPAVPAANVRLDHESRPIRYITLRNGRRNWWAGAEPNTMILQYLCGDDAWFVKCMKEQIANQAQEPTN